MCHCNKEGTSIYQHHPSSIHFRVWKLFVHCEVRICRRIRKRRRKKRKKVLFVMSWNLRWFVKKIKKNGGSWRRNRKEYVRKGREREREKVRKMRAVLNVAGCFSRTYVYVRTYVCLCFPFKFFPAIQSHWTDERERDITAGEWKKLNGMFHSVFGTFCLGPFSLYVT